MENAYPESTLGTIMAITAVVDGNEALEGYEVIVRTAGGQAIEVTMAPDGTILEEDSADEG